MERIRADEQMDAATTSSLPWMSEEVRVATVADIQRRAAGRLSEEQERWGGGYGSDVVSEKLENFTGKI